MPRKAPSTSKWIPISHSLAFMLRNRKVFAWSLLLSALTIIITGISFFYMTAYIDDLGKNFFTSGQSSLAWWQVVKDYFFTGLKWLYLIGTRIICFYLSFLIAYTLTSPGYFFLSHATEKIYAGSHFDPDAAFTLKGTLRDLWEGTKIAMLGIVVTLMAFFLNFIPLLGQALVILLYTFYSTLIFIDYPASRRQWPLGKKTSWLRANPFIALRLGIFPALISLIPVINIFGMALLFPLMTVHATLNFVAIEISPQKKV